MKSRVSFDWTRARDPFALKVLERGLEDTLRHVRKQIAAIEGEPAHKRGGQAWATECIRDAREVIALMDTGLFKKPPIGHVTGHDAVRSEAVGFWVDRMLKKREFEKLERRKQTARDLAARHVPQRVIAERLGVSQSLVSGWMKTQPPSTSPKSAFRRDRASSPRSRRAARRRLAAAASRTEEKRQTATPKAAQ